MDEAAGRVRRVSQELQRRASILRQTPTPAELVLWGELKGRKLNDLRFRRQHPVGRFILDFFCPAVKLVVEVDGDVHDAQSDRDYARTEVLNAHGYRVIRFRNEEVLYDLVSVLTRIRSAASAQGGPSAP